MKLLKKVKSVRVLFIIFALILSGCGIQQTATTIDTTTNFTTPEAGYAGVYFFRWKINSGTLIGDTDIVINGKKIAELYDGEYLYLELPRKEYTVLMLAGALYPDIEKKFIFEPGRNYFFRVGTEHGFEAAAEITSDSQIIDAQNGIKSKYKRIYGDNYFLID